MRGAAGLQWVFGFHQEPSKQIGVSMIDLASIAAIPEWRLTEEHWKQLQTRPTGLFFSRTEAAKWNVKPGDVFPVQTPTSDREDGATAWPFEVLGIVDDPARQVDWTPNIYGNYEYFDAVRTGSQRGTVRFIVAIDDPARAEPICQQIDTSYANSSAPTYCVPLQVDARSIIDLRHQHAADELRHRCRRAVHDSFPLRQQHCGVGARARAGVALLQTLGFGNRKIATLVFLESALPCFAGAVLGTAIAQALATFTTKLTEGAELPIPPASLSLSTCCPRARRCTPDRRGQRDAAASATQNAGPRVSPGREMTMLRHVLTVSGIGLSTLAQRRGTSIVIAAGVACVVGVLVLDALRRRRARADVSLRAEAKNRRSFCRRTCSRKPVPARRSTRSPRSSMRPELRRTRTAPCSQTPASSPASWPPPGFPRDISARVRGIGAAGLTLREDFQIESGRLLRRVRRNCSSAWASREGSACRAATLLLMPGGFWPIVGTFSDGGGRSESEFFADSETLRSATQRKGFGSVIVKLANTQAFDELQRWLTTNPAIAVDAYRVSDYLVAHQR